MNNSQSNYQQEQSTTEFALWNPNVSGLWSIIVAPFGAWIHSKNWKTLGNDKLCKYNQYYALTMVFSMFTNRIFDMLTGFESRPSLVAIILIIWYFHLGRKQTEFVTQHYTYYQRKSWLKPILIGQVGFIVLWIIISKILIVSFDYLGILHSSWYE